MRWKGRRQSENVEDRRGGGAPGGIGIVLIVIGLLGGKPQQFLQQAGQNQPAAAGGVPTELTAQEIETGEFVATVFADTEDVWTRLFTENDRQYEKPKPKLQADFLAGVMLHHADRMHNIIEKGDIEEALTAAQAIDDDTLQKRSKGYVQPETFSHGTSEQRVRWFTKGLQTGDLGQVDTFGVDTLKRFFVGIFRRDFLLTGSVELPISLLIL